MIVPNTSSYRVTWPRKSVVVISFDPFDEPGTTAPVTVTRAPPVIGVYAVVRVIVAMPVGPTVVCCVTRPRASYVVHDQSVSPLTFVPATRPIAS